MDRRLLLTRVDELHTIGEATLRARVLLDGLVGIFASAYIVHDLAELHDFVTDDAVFFVQCEALDIALSEFEVTRAFLQRAIQRAAIWRNSSRIAVLIASQTGSVFRASRTVRPGRISAAIAAECVMPEQPIVSTRHS